MNPLASTLELHRSSDLLYQTTLTSDLFHTSCE